MKEEVSTKLNIWASQHPESYHQFDTNRLYDLAYECYKHGEQVSVGEIRDAFRNYKSWKEEFLLNLADESHDRLLRLIEFLEYLRGEGGIRITD